MRHLAAVLFGISLCVGCFVVLHVGFQFTNDGPQHLLGAYVHHNYSDSEIALDETCFSMSRLPITVSESSCSCH